MLYAFGWRRLRDLQIASPGGLIGTMALGETFTQTAVSLRTVVQRFSLGLLVLAAIVPINPPGLAICRSRSLRHPKA